MAKGDKKVVDEKEVDQVTAAEYFKNLKENKHTITDEGLRRIQANCLTLFDKYERTGQKDAVKKLYYHIATIEREHKAIAAGVDMFVYLSDIRPLLDRVEGRNAK